MWLPYAPPGMNNAIWRGVAIVTVMLMISAAPPLQPNPNPPKDPLFFAKADIRGVLISKAREPGELAWVSVRRPDRQSVNIYLDIRQLKTWNEDKLNQAHFRIVRVSGQLGTIKVTVRPGVDVQRIVLNAKSIEVMADAEEDQYKGNLYEKGNR